MTSDPSTPIVVTGGFGFIGSNLVEYLNRQDIVPYVTEDLANIGEKWRNMIGLRYRLITCEAEWPSYPIIIHLGAISSTRVPMDKTLWETNFALTMEMHKRSSKLIYASSAATYGSEQRDFSERIEGLKPINPYGFSKWSVDNHFFGHGNHFPQVYGLRPFNVFGPRERHKGNVMASSVHNAIIRAAFYKTDKATPYWQLMASGHPSIPNDKHLRDFVYVEDVCQVIDFFIKNYPEAGIYNVGTGTPRGFTEVLKIVEDLPVEYRPMPEGLHSAFQYYTCADLTKLRAAGYTAPFTTLEEGIAKTRAYLVDNPV